MKKQILLSSTLFIFLATLFVLNGNPLAQVQWTPDGVAICTANNSQENPKLVSDYFRGAIIAWKDKRGGNYDIFVQRVYANGNVLWLANGVEICTAIDEQSSPQLISDGNGGAIVTWQDKRGGNYDVYAQRIDVNGNVLWTANGVAICTASNDQSSPQLVSDGNGGAILTWHDYRNGDFNVDIYAQRVDKNGNVLWASNGIAVCTANSNQTSPQVMSDGSGGAILCWEDARSNYDIYAQRVEKDGNVLWTANGIAVCMDNGTQASPQMVSDGNGGAIITWLDYRSGSNWDVYAQLINANGNVLWTANGVAICAANNDQNSPQLVSDDSGGAIITWQDKRSGSYDVYAQRIDLNGNVLWTANGVAICTANNDQSSPQLVSDGSSGAIITWYDHRNSSYYKIYAQRLNGNGNMLWIANGVNICAANSNQQSPQLVSDGSGGAILTWQVLRSGYNDDIYTQRVNDNGMLITPNGGEYWAGGSNQDIEWVVRSEFPVDHVSILYSSDGGSTYPDEIIDNTPNDGSYNCIAPVLNSAMVKIKVQTKDAANAVLTSNASDNNFIVDSTPPNAFNLLLPVNGSWNTNLPTFTWTSTTDNFEMLKYELGIDGVLNRDSISVSNPSTTPISPLSTGIHTWNVKAIDKAGNARISNQTWSVRIDNEAPASFNLITPANNIWSVDGRENFNWQPSSDAGSGLNEYVLHIGSQVISLQATQTTYQPSSTSTSGSYEWYVKAIDVVGNVKESSERRTLQVDNTPPNAFDLVSPTNSAWTRESTPTFSWAGTQDTGSGLAKYELYIDNTKFIDNISPMSISIELDCTSALNEGSYSWYINALDSVGNIRKSNQTYILQVDLTPPAAFTLKSPANNAYVNFPTPDFTWNETSDNRSGLSHYSLWIDSVLSVDNITSTTSSPGLPITEGSHTWYVRAVDKVGNWKESSERWTIIGEWNPPEPFDLAFPPDGATVTSGKPVFRWHRTADIGTGLKKYQLWIDGVLSTDNIPAIDSMAVPSTMLSNGIHYWLVKAINNADNERPSASTWQVTIDRTGNQAPKIDPISDETAIEDLPFYFKVSASDPNPYNILRFTDNTNLFDIDFYTGEISFTPTNEDVGEHQIMITATDGDLNSTASFKMTIVNVNDAPNTFSLIYPAHFALIETLNPALTWEQAIDIDKNDIVHYQVYIDTVSTFASPIVFDNIVTTSFRVAYGLKKSEEYFWKVSAIDLAGAVTECQSFFKFITSATATQVLDHTNGVSPNEFVLFQNYPNPFNPETSISFQIPKSCQVVMTIYNTMGQEIKTVLNEKREAGYHQIVWDGTDNSGQKVGTGIYLYRMNAGEFTNTKKMIMIH